MVMKLPVFLITLTPIVGNESMSIVYKRAEILLGQQYKLHGKQDFLFHITYCKNGNERDQFLYPNECTTDI